MNSLISEFLPHIIAALAVIGGALGLYYKEKSKGRQDAENEQREIDAEARDRRDDACRDYQCDGASDRLRDGDSSSAVQPTHVCYTDAFQAKAAEELASMPPACARNVSDTSACSPVATLVNDYGVTRAEIRAIRDEDVCGG